MMIQPKAQLTEKMKRILNRGLVAVLVMSVAASLTAGHAALAQASASDSAAVTNQIQPLIGEMVIAANAHDTDRYMQTLIHDQSALFVFNGAVIYGWADIAAQQRKWWNNGKSDVVYSDRGMTRYTVLSRDAAVVTIGLDSRRTLADGKIGTGTAIVTMVWQRRPEGWRIVQEHESTAR